MSSRHKSVSDRRLISFHQRGIIVQDKLFTLHNKILFSRALYNVATVLKRAKQHEFSVLLGCTSILIK